MDMKDINKVIQPGQEGAALEGVNKLMQQMGHIAGYLQHLEQGLVTMSHEVQAQGLGLQMIYRLLVDNGVCVEEEIKQYHAEHVVKPMQEAMAEMQKKVQQAEEMAKEAQEAAMKEQKQIIETVESSEEVEETDSDVVLASERGNVVRFPSGKQDS